MGDRWGAVVLACPEPWQRAAAIAKRGRRTACRPVQKARRETKVRDQVFMQGDAGMHHLSFRPVDGLAALAAQHVATARKMLAMLLGEERTEIPAPTIHGVLNWALVPIFRSTIFATPSIDYRHRLPLLRVK